MSAGRIERAVADDLIRAIYEAENWEHGDRAGFSSRSARCNSIYEITSDPRRNRYVAVRKAAKATAQEGGAQ